MLKIAIPKGRLLEEVSDLFVKSDIIPFKIEESRKLIVDISCFRFLIVKPSDVTTYVEQGAADIGVVGLDVMKEEPKEVYEILDLENIGKCSMVVAGKPEKIEDYKILHFTKVATKYVNIARSFFEDKDVSINIIKLNGSVEIAPIIGLSDYIVDITQTGKTLKENGLVVMEKIFDSYAKIICNKAAFRIKKYDIFKILDKLSDI